MFEEGLKALDVAEELDVSRATAFRWQKAWRADPGCPDLQEEP
jgi:transposase